jgi:peptidase M48-like protein
MIDADFAAHGVTLSFAWFVVCNVVLSIAVAAAVRLLRPRASGASNAAWWLALRLTPALASALFVLALFVPSYLKYEPRESVEGFDLTLTLVAAAAVLLVAISLTRGILAWRSAARRVGGWVRHARLLPQASAAWQMPVFIVDSDRPFIALGGIRSPRLLVTRGLMDALTSAELNAAIAHEIGHRRAWDNLKRLAMRSAPDFLRFTAAARDLERRWASAAEHVADGAAGPAPATRCALASALVKVARLTVSDHGAGNGRLLAEPISTLIGGGEITSRVQRLLDDPQMLDTRRRFPVLAAGVAAACTLVLTYAPLLRAVHDTTERLIRIVA